MERPDYTIRDRVRVLGYDPPLFGKCIGLYDHGGHIRATVITETDARFQSNAHGRGLKPSKCEMSAPANWFEKAAP